MGDLQFLQVWHLHQPATQIRPWIDKAVVQAYGPLLQAYGRHPNIRYNLNITGSLLDQLEVSYPEVLKAAKQQIDSDSMEPLTTGYYQPIIPFIPKDHAVAQIRRNTQRVEGLFHRRPKAAWVPERAWEPWMPEVFEEAGVEAILLDDHLLKEPKSKAAKYSPWEATHGTAGVAVYLIDEEMRYYIPWKPVAEVMERLEAIADATDGRGVVTFADDGEKMGLWPGSEGIHPWLVEFLQALGERSWIHTTTLEDYLRLEGVKGEGTFASGSYVEMEEWCLGDLRNWLRHPLVRDMYGRLQLAMKALPQGPPPEAILRAEVNDPYWYARRMTYHRQEVYRNILEAEEGRTWAPAAVAADFNGDGREEVLLQDGQQRVFVGHDGRIYEWDHRDVAHNFVNTGFLDVGYTEDKPLRDAEVFSLPRRNCLTDFLDDEFLPASRLRANGKGATAMAKRGDAKLTKTLALVGGVLHCRYTAENGGDVSIQGRLAVEACFTPPTDTVEASIRDYHRHIFDYAGQVVDRPVEDGHDGPGVAWAALQDNLHGVVAGAAWRPGAIAGHARGIAAEGATSTPTFVLDVPSGSRWEMEMRLVVGRGDHRRVAELLRGLL